MLKIKFNLSVFFTQLLVVLVDICKDFETLLFLKFKKLANLTFTINYTL